MDNYKFYDEGANDDERNFDDEEKIFMYNRVWHKLNDEERNLLKSLGEKYGISLDENNINTILLHIHFFEYESKYDGSYYDFGIELCDILICLKSPHKPIKFGKTEIGSLSREILLNGFLKELHEVYYHGKKFPVHLGVSPSVTLDELKEMKNDIWDEKKSSKMLQKSKCEVIKELSNSILREISNHCDNVTKKAKCAFIYDILYKFGFRNDDEDDFEELTDTDKFDRIKRYFKEDFEDK